MSSVSAISSQVAAPARFHRAAGACRSLLIGRSRRQNGLVARLFAAAHCPSTGLRLTRACKFLLFSRAAECRAGRRRRFRAAPHKIVVSINGNASAHASADDWSRRTSHWTLSEKSFSARVCTAAQAGKEQCPINRATTANNTPWNRPAPWMNAGASASGCGGGLREKEPGPVRRLRRLGAGRSIVNACRSLLTHGLRPAEPVRSGGSRGRPDGQSRACRPPSRLTESGGRP